MSLSLDFRTPVVCRHGHRTFWYWYIPKHGMLDFGEVIHLGAEWDSRCTCPERGKCYYVRDGDDQMSTGYTDKKTGQQVYEGDLVVASYHWVEPHEIKLSEDFYDFYELALWDDLTVVGSAFVGQRGPTPRKA